MLSLLVSVQSRYFIRTVTVYALTSHITPLKTLRTTLVTAIFRQFDSVLDFLILQDKHNIRTLSLNIKMYLHEL